MRWWGWLILVLVVMWVMKHPGPASADVHNVGAFFSNLTG